jgi:hypothetical protein
MWIVKHVGGEWCSSHVSFQGEGSAHIFGWGPNSICVIAGFCCEVDVNCAVLGYCAASSGNFLRTLQDNLPVPSSGVKRKVGWIGCPEMSLRN